MARRHTICILGGTGFVGRHLVHRLSRQGHWLRVPTRHRERHRDLLVDPSVSLLQANVHDPRTLRDLLRDCDVAINLVGVLNDTSRDGHLFQQVHVELPRKLVQAALERRVPRLLHMSALNADPGERASRYLRTKGEGEALVHEAASLGLRVTSFRPSVIFGPDDRFFNRFALLLRLSPGLFPLACPDARFAPVYVGNVAEAFARAIDDPRTLASRCELCGPEAFSLRELVALTAQELGVRRRILGLGPRLSWLQARLLEWLPGTPFTRDNFHALQHPSLCSDNCLPRLGIEPTAIDAVLPLYLGRRSARARIQELRRYAHHSP